MSLRRYGFLSFACVFLLLQGCTALRPQDDSRTEIAQKAVAQVQELRQQDGGPFAPDQEDTDLAQAWQSVAQLQSEDRQSTFYATLGSMTHSDLRDEFILSLQVHLQALRGARGQAQAAAQAVSEQLARQEQLGIVAGDSVPEGTHRDLGSVLQSIEQRLTFLRDLQVKITRVLTASETLRANFDQSTTSEPSASKPPSNLEQTSTRLVPEDVDERLEQVQGFLKQVQADPQVQASGALLLRSGQQLAAVERQRLAELKTYLLSIQANVRQLESRQEDYFRSLAIPVMAALLEQKEFWSTIDTIDAALGSGTCPGDFDPQTRPTLPTLDDTPPTSSANDGATSSTGQDAIASVECFITDLRALETEWNQQIGANQARWKQHSTVLEFVQASLQATEAPSPLFGSPSTMASRLIPQLAMVLFVEEPADLQAEFQIAALRHQHALRLAQINTDERLALVEQVAQALEIYYQGGLSPAEVAEAILLGSHVLATAFIGTRL